MKFRVFHAVNPNFSDTCPPDAYERVADVELPDGLAVSEALEEVYRLTNSIEYSWTENSQEVTHLYGERFRSTSAGDVVRNLDDGTYWLCGRAGWMLLPESFKIAGLED